MERLGLSREDAQNMDLWRLKIMGKLANLGLSGKMPLKWCVFCC